jgi:peptidoglycan/LPS O-acetylase OafA/YrhL
VGVVSYGIFLWHLPLLEWLKRTGVDAFEPVLPVASLGLIGLAGSVVLGWASYRLVERPAMRLRADPPKRED